MRTFSLTLLGSLLYLKKSIAWNLGRAPSQLQLVTRSLFTSTTLHEQSIQDNDDTPSSRRFFLLSSTSAITAAVLSQSKSAPIATSDSLINNNDSTLSTTGMNTKQIIRWIDENCDRRFLHAMVSSDYSFLYRGVSSNSSKGGRIQIETPDLLSRGTYPPPQAKDALLYFQRLEDLLQNENVKPSNGHLATTSIEDASQWGDSYSVWPLDGAHYAWLIEKGPFFPSSSSNVLTREDYIVDGRDCGKMSLEDALHSKNCEVMISSPSDSFLMVPSSMDEELRAGLKNSFLV